uniref:Spindle and kinetochore associated complex subunit 3 n=1 Tax=Gasterosteus aculeatus aculeatus TaxID=481459 RepID=G3N935_GASAC
MSCYCCIQAPFNTTDTSPFKIPEIRGKLLEQGIHCLIYLQYITLVINNILLCAHLIMRDQLKMFPDRRKSPLSCWFHHRKKKRVVVVTQGQIQGQIAQQRAQDNELDRFIKVARVMEQRLAKDIQALKGHWEKYGYQAPQDTRRPTMVTSCTQMCFHCDFATPPHAETEDEAAAEMETESTNEGVNQEEDGGSRSSSSSPRPSPGPPSLADPLRTPQLSDFGLSEVEMKRALAGVEWCSEAPLMPELSLRHPSLSTPAPPPMPLTPKRALRMDDDELQAPQMSDFGLSEHTMCLNNDFTMDLLRKNYMYTLNRSLQNLVSPEPPVFLTPGFKVSRTDAPRSPPARSGNLPASPEVPVFETPYMNPMAASRKVDQFKVCSARQPEPVDARADGGPPSPRSKRRWEYDVPDVSIAGAEDNPMPAMPNLESALGNSLQTVRRKHLFSQISGTQAEESAAQDFSPGTPRLRVDYQEPSTPEMPDLSSVTQDICKVSPAPSQLLL